MVGGERNALDRVISRGGALAAWLVFLAMAISVFEVIMRYAFDSPTSWVHESVVFLVAVSFALGGPATLAANRTLDAQLDCSRKRRGYPRRLAFVSAKKRPRQPCSTSDRPAPRKPV
jgi:hypothetical protein